MPSTTFNYYTGPVYYMQAFISFKKPVKKSRQLRVKIDALSSNII